MEQNLIDELLKLPLEKLMLDLCELEEFLKKITDLKNYVKEQKKRILRDYPEEINGILVLNYIEKKFLDELK